MWVISRSSYEVQRSMKWVVESSPTVVTSRDSNPHRSSTYMRESEISTLKLL
ncbi:unnamed protein product [Spirodela intermedia]|uniref:Uncharacterized protein n=1 Tax=Spirodela intermedia TaxID=51605 RepID=A0A7I8IAK5_SPIIN|nr:unnamed protein product [Spirodela intermedia]CAA6654062.1 unnamed protein product [Spirodela intermedia]